MGACVDGWEAEGGGGGGGGGAAEMGGGSGVGKGTEGDSLEPRRKKATRERVTMKTIAMFKDKPRVSSSLTLQISLCNLKKNVLSLQSAFVSQ